MTHNFSTALWHAKPCPMFLKGCYVSSCLAVEATIGHSSFHCQCGGDRWVFDPSQVLGQSSCGLHNQ
eukprot:302979-Amphidinium_carterae.1